MKTKTNDEAILECLKHLESATKFMTAMRFPLRDQKLTQAQEDLLNAQGEVVTAMSWMIKLSASL